MSVDEQQVAAWCFTNSTRDSVALFDSARRVVGFRPSTYAERHDGLTAYQIYPVGWEAFSVGAQPEPPAP